MPSNSQLVLVINCGSSSLKFALLSVAAGEVLLSGLAECLGLPDARLVLKENEARDTVPLDGGAHAEALTALLTNLAHRGLLNRIAAVGHRVVHGGERFTASVLITPEVLSEIEKVSSLAPLHNPANLLGVRECLRGLPDVPQVAVFDTAFHQTLPEIAYIYAVPQKFYREYGIRRYGFHGTSHRYIATEVVRLQALRPADHGLIIAHLGNGASATAVRDGQSVDTTMGLTPLEGFVMGTRSGDIDFGAAAHMARVEGLDLDAVEQLLNKESGLLGLSELSNDCRMLEAAAREGHAGARLALGVFAHRAARLIGGLATSLQRLDALVFTGGIGENSARVRELILGHLSILGLTINARANQVTVGTRCGRIDANEGPAVWVIPTDEEGLIARDAARVAGLDHHSTQTRSNTITETAKS